MLNQAQMQFVVFNLKPKYLTQICRIKQCSDARYSLNAWEQLMNELMFSSHLVKTRLPRLP